MKKNKLLPNLKLKSLEQVLKEQYPTKQARAKLEEGFNRLSLGYQIYVARKKKHLTQSQLAKKIKTKQSVVARIETGQQNLTTEKLNDIAKALNKRLTIVLK